ncbi:hypothetical protein PsYK624_134730 [Phanerochaete sordida]|uniref:Uncharacterized protein n=1 Tax=Phanerochaete sordida TaxID=48140 RepID=A0A9P3LKH6_9APHY|nr:hypothetical protein PsYK624_134730 [Phanerochaete sordida]
MGSSQVSPLAYTLLRAMNSLALLPAVARRSMRHPCITYAHRYQWHGPAERTTSICSTLQRRRVGWRPES